METNESFCGAVEHNRDIFRIADRGSDEREERLLGFGWFGRRRGAATRWATTGGMGGRRDAEKIGRSRVASSVLIGIPHSGLPPGGGCRAPMSLGAAGSCSVFGLG